MNNTSASGTLLHGKYLSVLVQHESYGIPAIKVREIIRFQKITPLPQLPDFIKGVINLRGRLVPVLDLRLKFGLEVEYAARTCIVVVLVDRRGSGASLPIGLIVDSVADVISLRADQIEPMPHLGANLETGGMLGVAKVDGQIKTLLDVDHIVAADALEVLASQVGV